ncbi:OLC1v1016068C1 [Oldenlandia corymbosa var. corymbosa]|uniref:OLC1v1016068C1 n=1 Tax=Oldenlandia corymbosa var. corymbosa TaxID=529605 RepID=A0AAV1E780_OLDCO|nr:OLC1v1016068C1 [Oldenlandia corymbosa var. corymbosa]
MVSIIGQRNHKQEEKVQILNQNGIGVAEVYGGNTVMGSGDLGMIRKEWWETSQLKKRNGQNKTITPQPSKISSPRLIETLDTVNSRLAVCSDAIVDLDTFVHQMRQYVIPVKTTLDPTKHQVVVIMDCPTKKSWDHDERINDFDPEEDLMIENNNLSSSRSPIPEEPKARWRSHG